ncbi:Bax inhibitor-1/YccA family protein [Fulvimarina sp. 2208YS6-2-32]|uniref:Bax inhibitor-1/YccA family protein n=1 Tax=Fulvimarina uroteuthidis TaxID=3098149 RepID=A0ABU5HWV8_9HYPH|nr:Bax inhibitor-1/YccA family protein [Fulvimarina sp. 2208YS6-2-32]MDY8107626.1 Bax inhibitor-1/YccA family protein [Fulvimarina sp. 2208YS6-2-32]
MADYRNSSTRTVPAAGTRADVDVGLRTYMLKVYNLMAGGVALTGVASYAMYMLSFVTNDAGEVIGLTQLGNTVFNTPLRWLVMLAPLGMVLFLSFRVHKMSVAAAQTTFWVYAAMVGVSLASIFAVYTGESITQVFFITAATFGALSLWGYTTKRDISGWGSFLFMGLIGIIIAMVVNIFLASPAIQFAISVIGVLVFAGLTAYDTQQIKEMYYEGDGSAVAGRKAVMGALRLYLDFLNMFLMLLNLFGNRE